MHLTSVAASDDKQHPLVDPLDPTQQITRIAWSPHDALLFPICISSTTDAAHGARPVYPVSVARGNVVAAAGSTLSGVVNGATGNGKGNGNSQGNNGNGNGNGNGGVGNGNGKGNGGHPTLFE